MMVAVFPPRAALLLVALLSMAVAVAGSWPVLPCDHAVPVALPSKASLENLHVALSAQDVQLSGAGWSVSLRWPHSADDAKHQVRFALALAPLAFLARISLP
eukprot:c3402_g1_i2.p2 GENE.c3402_g1_i2~~c3402_g1_i2.p2  ORF type:complete len:102 (+),score=11.88 c3402_g1_i2:36-341(+)